MAEIKFPSVLPCNFIFPPQIFCASRPLPGVSPADSPSASAIFAVHDCDESGIGISHRQSLSRPVETSIVRIEYRNLQWLIEIIEIH